MEHQRIRAAIRSELWAITPEALQQIDAIAHGFGDPEAVAAKLGKPLANSRNVTVRDGVAIVPFIGPVFRYANLFSEISGATSIQTLATDFQTAVDDPNVKAIILEIDSPGGQVSGVSEFAAQVRAANAIKPVVSYVSNTSASAAYWVASAASEIVASDTARLGSIGAVMQLDGDEEDGSFKFISSQSPLKQVDPATDAGKAEYQKTVDALAEVFINSVADYRGVDPANVLTQFGQGGMMIASEAIAAGMADRLGSLETLIAQLSGGKPLSNPKRGNNTMSITRDVLAADHPDLLAAIIAEGHAAGLAEGKSLGAEAERVRIQGIEFLAMPGHDALVASLKFDGKTTAEQAALQILAAEKATRESMAGRIASDTPKPVKHSAPAFNDGDEDEDGDGEELTGAAKWEHEWKHSAALQAEFRSVDSYVAYQNASAKGLVKRVGAK